MFQQQVRQENQKCEQAGNPHPQRAEEAALRRQQHQPSSRLRRSKWNACSRDGSGLGQAAILNQDGTLNSSANPAKAGAVVAVYMPGIGNFNPSLPDGVLGPLEPPFPQPMLGVSATVNSEPAPILLAGQAPGLIAGVAQVNVLVPEDTMPGKATLAVYVGNYVTPYRLPYFAVQ